MSHKQQRVLSAVIVYETDQGNLSPTDSYMLQSLKGTFRGMRNGSAAIAVFNSNGIQLGVDITGDPSDAMKKLMELEFADPGAATG